MENIEDLINKFKNIITPLLPQVEKEVNQTIDFIENNKIEYFIKKENNEKKYIYNFDQIIELKLDYLMNPFTEKYFHKLLYYWEELNHDSANYYKKLWREYYED